MEKVDCVVVGGGWYGLGAAKQYHWANPQASLVVLEREATLGGTWADHRLYPGLKSNNLLGSYEYPDFPMDPETFGVTPNKYIPGAVLNAYLKAYAAKFGIDKLVRFRSSVSVARHIETGEGGWELTVVNQETGQETKLLTKRLIVATGLTSQAFLPHFEGQETFGGPVFHGKDFLQHADTIVKGNTVTILGASKSSWDAVYAYATAGVKVNWIVRSSGHGPCWMSPSYVTPFKQWIEALANTRFLSWFSPCIFADDDGYSGIRRFLHGTALGRALVNGFWSVLGGDVMALNRYDDHPDTAKLKPWTHAMFTGPSFSILNYDTNFWDLVRGDLVNVYIGELQRLGPGTVHLADGTVLESSALLANTGWKHVPPIRFLPEGIEREMGVPHEPPQSVNKLDLASQRDLIDRVDADILARFPRLRDQPVWNKDYVPLPDTAGADSDDAQAPGRPVTPYMLYRFIVPASERLLRTRDVAFVGVVSSFSNPINAHIQGLWIAAYFSGRLARDPAAGAVAGDSAAVDRVRYEAALHNRFGHWRYPTDWGSTKAPSFIFDAVPYLDMLQADLGLNPHRKKGGFLADMWSPYLSPDYRTINEDWERAQREAKSKDD